MPFSPAAFALNEDDALKLKLTNFGNDYAVQIPATGAVVPIQVFYRFPDSEQVQRQATAFITIELVDIQFAPDRAHRADGYIDPATGNVADDMPLPWSLIYQLGCYSRDPRIDRQLVQLMYFQFPEQFGALDMTSIDGTVRRADFVSATRRDRIDQWKMRLYNFIYTIAVSSEFYTAEVQEIAQVMQINPTFIYTVNDPFSG